MNYYPRYIGDYISATLHLTMEQDGAFNRLLDWSYKNERPIPHASRYAVARAVSAREKAAVDAVLAEFFQQGPEGWVNDRVVQEIERARPKMEAARSNGLKGGRPRKRGPQPPSDGNPVGFQNETQEGTQQGTETEPSTKAPHPQNQKYYEASRQAPEIPQGTAAGLACRLMRDAGCTGTNPSHADLLAALAAGVTPQALADTVREALEVGIRKPFAWSIATALGRHLDGPRAAQGRAPGQSLADAAAAAMSADPAPVVAGVIPFRGTLVHER